MQRILFKLNILDPGHIQSAVLLVQKSDLYFQNIINKTVLQRHIVDYGSVEAGEE